MTLARLPYSLSHNLTLVDRSGRRSSPRTSRPTVSRSSATFPAATNHQGIVEWPEQARATRTIEREQAIVRSLEDPAIDADGVHRELPAAAAVLDVVRERVRHALHRGVPRGGRGRGVRWPSDAWRERSMRSWRPSTPRCSRSPPSRLVRLTEATGAMRTETFTVDTRGRRVIDVTDGVRAFARRAGGDGLVHVFVPHATAGVALMETGSGSEADLEELLERVCPARRPLRTPSRERGPRRRPPAPRLRRALADAAGGGRPGCARDVAVGGARRPEPRERRADACG